MYIYEMSVTTVYEECNNVSSVFADSVRTSVALAISQVVVDEWVCGCDVYNMHTYHRSDYLQHTRAIHTHNTHMRHTHTYTHKLSTDMAYLQIAPIS